MNGNKKIHPINNENGMVMVVAIMVIAVLVLLGSTAILTTTTDMKINSNYTVGSQAFYIADAGIEHARHLLRSTVSSSHTLSQELAGKVGGNGQLSDSTQVNNLFSGGNFVTDDTPLVADTTHGAGTYRVYMTNDTVDGITSTGDLNNRVTITSFGRGHNNSLSVIQAVVQRIQLPTPPGAIVLPGPNVIFNGANSNATGVWGGAYSAIALNAVASETTVENHLTSIGRINNYECNAGQGTPCIDNAPAAFDPAYSTLSGLMGLYNLLNSVADYKYSGTRVLTAADVGTASDPKIVVVDGNATLGPVNGTGILIVTGQLILSGNFNYTGIILCIGEGNLLRNGGGNGTINGSVVVANTNGATSETVLGVPTYDLSGGGNSDINFDANAINPPSGRVFAKLSWRHM